MVRQTAVGASWRWNAIFFLILVLVVALDLVLNDAGWRELRRLHQRSQVENRTHIGMTMPPALLHDMPSHWKHHMSGAKVAA